MGPRWNQDWTKKGPRRDQYGTKKGQGLYQGQITNLLENIKYKD
jgi:hypothetical protein